jgi:hypothetical protein
MVRGMLADVIPFDSTEAARQWAVTVLTRAAERFEALPDEELCEMLLRVTGILRSWSRRWRRSRFGDGNGGAGSLDGRYGRARRAGIDARGVDDTGGPSIPG